MICEICKEEFKGSRVGVCSSTRACKSEWQRRTRANPNPNPQVLCEVCRKPFRGSTVGVCRRTEACRKERAYRRYWAEPEKHRTARRDYSRQVQGTPEQKARVAKYRFSRHGVTRQWHDDQLARQGGHCAICPRTEPGGRGYWHIDHDHRHCPGDSGCIECVRGLLCSRCNVGIGMLGDSVTVLQAAIQYLTVRNVSDSNP